MTDGQRPGEVVPPDAGWVRVGPPAAQPAAGQSGSGRQPGATNTVQALPAAVQDAEHCLGGAASLRPLDARYFPIAEHLDRRSTADGCSEVVEHLVRPAGLHGCWAAEEGHFPKHVLAGCSAAGVELNSEPCSGPAGLSSAGSSMLLPDR